MQNRKPGQVKSGFFVKGKRINAVVLSLSGDESCGRLGKRQLTEIVLDGDLPSRDALR